MRHLTDFGNLARVERESLYQRYSDITGHPADFMGTCRGRVMASPFYESSTYTNLSFQTAMLRVGGAVFGFADPKSTSTVKGKTSKNTIKTTSGYADVVVTCNPKEGAAKVASLYSDTSVINVGDGGHTYPTQTTADFTTITHLWGKVDGLSAGLCGDSKNGCMVHSLIEVLAKFKDIKLFLVAPYELAVPGYIRALMREHGMWFTKVTGLEAVILQLDILYMTCIQRERFVDPLEYERRRDVCILTWRKLDWVKKELLVVHPLPRVDEIAIDVGNDPRVVYFEQVRYSMYARMALLTDLANQEREEPEPVEIGVKPVCSNPNCIIQTEYYLPPPVKQNGGVDCCTCCDKESQ